jgi:hypothetical protein
MLLALIRTSTTVVFAQKVGGFLSATRFGNERKSAQPPMTTVAMLEFS